MADTRPTKLRFFYIMYLCLLAVIYPKQLIEEEKKDNESRNNFSERGGTLPRAYLICRAFWYSFSLIILFGGIGALLGFILYNTCNQPSPSVIIFLQAFGAGLLLWGTLFIRGWEIQSYCGVTLSERVNQWIYRALYCIGTFVIICSLVWNLKNS